MQWICLAKRPLSVTELRLAMESDDAPGLVEEDGRMEKLVSSLSGGLAEMRGDVVQFIHQSVKDFLLTDGLMFVTSAPAKSAGQCSRESTNLSITYVIGRSHDRLSRSCINHLQREEVLQLGRKWNSGLELEAAALALPFS